MTKLPADDRQIAKDFFNEWIGARGPKGWVGRYISNTGRWYANMLIREGKISSHDKILDVGCGSATTIVNLLKIITMKELVYGIEPTEAQFELAKKNITTARLQDKVVLKPGFAAPLPFADNTFDVVYASFIIKHFADRSVTEFFQEAHRVLKPGGRFLGWEFARVTSGFFRFLAKDPKKAMQNWRDFSDIKPFLEKAGFTDISEFKVENRGFWDPVEDVGFKAEKPKKKTTF